MAQEALAQVAYSVRYIAKALKAEWKKVKWRWRWESAFREAKHPGDYFMTPLRELQLRYPPAIGDVRGLGLMIGVEIVKPDESVDTDTGDWIVVEGFKVGVVLQPYGDSVIRFSPPLVITKEADTCLNRFEAALKRSFPEFLRGSNATSDHRFG